MKLVCTDILCKYSMSQVLSVPTIRPFPRGDTVPVDGSHEKRCYYETTLKLVVRVHSELPAL